jgi:phosphoglycolate phosphatase
VRETLQALRTAGVKLVVMTNKEGRYTQTVLDAHDLAPMFDRVISGDTLPVKKPNPAGITDCLKQFGLSSDRALFVGDSSIDVATARNAGIAVWALPYGYNMGEPIEACNPDRVIPDFSALTTSLPARDTAASA